MASTEPRSPDVAVAADIAGPPSARRESLRDALATPERKHRYVARLFATIADRYDLITRLFSYGRDRRWKQRLMALAAIQPGERVLDLACGTGDLTFAAAARGGDAIGLDLTPRMIDLARRRAARTPTANPVQLLVGDMMALPLPDASVDVITTGYGLRNVPGLAAAIAEAHRVLRPGGRFYSLDFNRPRQLWLRALYFSYLTVTGSLAGLALHGDPDTYRYIPESIKRYPGADGVVDLLRAAGFHEARWIPVLGGLMAIHTARK